MTDDARRELGAFLRSHRERLRPADVGLSRRENDRRRTPGLRRDEVALLCGLSSTWLSWIEQGRDVVASGAALGRLADGLKLNRAERAYLFELARKPDPRQDTLPVSAAAPAWLQHVLAAVGIPAYALDRQWRACGWNGAALHLFGAWLGGSERSLLRYVFLDASAKEFIIDWPDRAARIVAEFRADTSRVGYDPDLQALAATLRARSPTFDTLWKAHDILNREGGLRLFNHPEDGRIAYRQVTLQPAGHEQFKIVLLLPQTGS